MEDKIKVVINNNEYEVIKNTCLLDLAKQLYNFDIDMPIIAKIGNEYFELTKKIEEPCNIEFIKHNEKQGNKVYLNSLIMMMSYAYRKLTGKNLKVNHSIDRGLYITTEDKISEEDVKKLEQKMKEIVEKDFLIEKITATRMDTMEYYKNTNQLEKFENMRYNTNTYITLYKLGDYYDYFYSLMAPSTRFLSSFKLTYLNENGFVLQYETIYDKFGIKEYVHRKNIYEMFQSSRSWAKSIGLEYASDLNNMVINSKIRDIILMDEARKNAEILRIANEVNDSGKIQIILIAGPSSSGKTTTCKRLSLALQSFGKSPVMLSMDDFFKDRSETPVKEDGSKDYENITAIDLDLFNQTIKDLLEGKEVIIPRYNFISGEKEFVNKLKLNDGEIILIEGIHALNPLILENIEEDKKCKIYLSALTELSVDRNNRISTTDNRLLRRMIRDNRTRGYKVEDTLKNWQTVREGEEKYIFPYQDVAKYTLNTALIYELGVLKVYAEPLLYSVDVNSPFYEDAKRLINFLRVFLPIPAELVEKDSTLREFIGGSIFE